MLKWRASTSALTAYRARWREYPNGLRRADAAAAHPPGTRALAAGRVAPCPHRAVGGGTAADPVECADRAPHAVVVARVGGRGRADPSQSGFAGPTPEGR